MAATHLLLGPVKRLTSVVQTIADGNLHVKANVEADDEIGSLANAFNDMTASINTLIDDLEAEVGSHKLTAENLNKLSQAIEQSPVSIMITLPSYRGQMTPLVGVWPTTMCFAP